MKLPQQLPYYFCCYFQDFFKILNEKRLAIEELQQHGTDGNVDIDEGVIWDVSQRFQTVEQSSQVAADRLSMEYYKNKVGQCIELCKEQLLDDNPKFGSQSQAEDAFNQHLVRSLKGKGKSYSDKASGRMQTPQHKERARGLDILLNRGHR